MERLELKIPPPVVALIVALMMWWVARHTGLGTFANDVWRLIFFVLLAIGFALEFKSVMSFFKSKTTVNPIRVENTSQLVTSGAYRFTRNPMYLGMAIILVGWTAGLGAPVTLFGPIVFVAYITKFQIMPEERFLLKRFDQRYADYQLRVRRWI